MLARNTIWHNLAFAVVLAGCSSSHATECPEVAGTCMTECCASLGRPTFDAACNPTCPSGASLLETCTPAPACGCGTDAGAAPRCQGGPCCDQEVAASPDGCGWTCPSGFSLECTPDPAAFCAAPWLACDAPSDCVLAPADGCCYPCGDSLTLEQVTAIAHDHAPDYYESQCPGELECPACEPAWNANLQTTCNDAGRCEPFDVRRLPLSACTADEDCRLRVPECCECGAPVDAARLIALNPDEVGAYTSLVCPSGAPSPDCHPCAAVYPDTVEAYCAPDGHCDVRVAP